MIGVIADASELEIAKEFFELFKTPWEPAVSNTKYSVLVSTGAKIDDFDADLTLVYSSREERTDRQAGVTVKSLAGPLDVQWESETFPIYGTVALFEGFSGAAAAFATGCAVAYRHQPGNRAICRIGFDIFSEVRHLLTDGQPSSCALIPTLELHIAWLRSLLLESRAPFVEIPPRPAGYEYICCLTHDLDFFGIRRHKGDWTLAGFVVRASLGTLVDLLRQRRSLADAMRNWAAALRLPFVFLGLVRDPWQPLEDYARVERGDRSTFFVVPFKGRPGVSPTGTINRRRAVKYQASDIRVPLQIAASLGSEIAVHGIDAWRDADAGREELRQVSSITGNGAGVRMHWLYFGADTPSKIESAGFRYDSSCGYNDAVGYRAGTGQVFRLRGCDQLLELPLSIMDSALFYKRRLGLSPVEAMSVCRQIVSNARRFGGTLVINWHDRSLAPERLWNRPYAELMNEIENGNPVWFATAEKAVDWFRWRRSIQFVRGTSPNSIAVKASVSFPAVAPARVLVHKAGVAGPTEIRFDGCEPLEVQL